jgi:hypothetical protein
VAPYLPPAARSKPTQSRRLGDITRSDALAGVFGGRSEAPKDVRAARDQVIQTQASIISYIDDFKLTMILSLVAIPVVLLLRSAPTAEASDHVEVME